VSPQESFEKWCHNDILIYISSFSKSIATDIVQNVSGFITAVLKGEKTINAYILRTKLRCNSWSQHNELMLA